MSAQENAREFHEVRVSDRSTGTDTVFNVPLRYTNLQFVGAGSKGVVVSADDAITSTKVAIKKVARPCISPQTAKRTIREFVLHSSVKHPNIIGTFSVFTPQQTEEEFKDVYLVMELMRHSLNDVIHRVSLDHKNISFFMYQILCAVNHLHREGIIHRDLKPRNIAVNDRCEVKVLDFALARLFNATSGRNMSAYVVTRHYRAPEIVLGMEYSDKVDIWSLGCIFAEMITGEVLFSGRDRIDQWKKIVEVMGTPSDSFISKLEKDTAMFVKSQKPTPAKSMEEVIPDGRFPTENLERQWTASAARNFLSKMLSVDPNERYSAAEALQDPYVSSWCMAKEVNAPLSCCRYSEELDEGTLSLDQLKGLIFKEVKKIESSCDIFVTK